MFLRSVHHVNGLRAHSALAHHTAVYSPEELATSSSALEDAARDLLADVLHLLEAAGISSDEVADAATERFENARAVPACTCGNLLDDNENDKCGPCMSTD